jgi:hypothetical protein
MLSGTQSEGFAMKLDSLIEICWVLPLMKSLQNKICKVIE